METGYKAMTYEELEKSIDDMDLKEIKHRLEVALEQIPAVEKKNKELTLKVRLLGSRRSRLEEEAKPPPPPVDRSQRTTTDGTGVEDTRRELLTNQQNNYVVLTEEERKKGFVRPVRRSYIHKIPTPKYPLRDLTDEEKERYEDSEYAKFEEYPKGCPEKIELSSRIGRFWTQAQLDRAAKGCGCVTTMGQAIAETYARDPGFYGSTFCVGCGDHYPVGRNGEFVWLDDPDQKVGT